MSKFRKGKCCWSLKVSKVNNAVFLQTHLAGSQGAEHILQPGEGMRATGQRNMAIRI